MLIYSVLTTKNIDLRSSHKSFHAGANIFLGGNHDDTRHCSASYGSMVLVDGRNPMVSIS